MRGWHSQGFPKKPGSGQRPGRWGACGRNAAKEQPNPNAGQASAALSGGHWAGSGQTRQGSP